MDRVVAKDIVEKIIKIGKLVNNIVALVKTIEDPAMRKELLESAGYLTGHSTDIALSIKRVYPELNPDL